MNDFISSTVADPFALAKLHYLSKSSDVRLEKFCIKLTGVDHLSKAKPSSGIVLYPVQYIFKTKCKIFARY